MSNVATHIAAIRQTIPHGVTLVCVSKYHPAEAIDEAYKIGERDFGESRVQELVNKHAVLPADIRWHMIGHLQTNKVRQVIPLTHLIHSVDSRHLIDTIDKEACRIHKKVNILLEIHVAQEQSKSGFAVDEFMELLQDLRNGSVHYTGITICGIMTMATNTDNEQEIRRCFHAARQCADALAATAAESITSIATEPIISMGMSDDYHLAIEEGSTMVRIGTTIFGERTY